MNHEIQSQMMVYSWENRRTSRFSIAKQGLLSRFVTHFPKWRIYRDLNRINIDLIYVGPSNSFRMINSTTSSVSHRIHGAGIYANIWGILWYIDGIHVTIYSSTMDPLGYANHWFLGGRDTQWLSNLRWWARAEDASSWHSGGWDELTSSTEFQRSLRWWWSWLDNWELFDKKWIKSPLLEILRMFLLFNFGPCFFCLWVYFIEEWRNFSVSLC